jgi:hypothetical protein
MTKQFSDDCHWGDKYPKFLGYYKTVFRRLSLGRQISQISWLLQNSFQTIVIGATNIPNFLVITKQFSDDCHWGDKYPKIFLCTL